VEVFLVLEAEPEPDGEADLADDLAGNDVETVL
jgi:hypothetical protein